MFRNRSNYFSGSEDQLVKAFIAQYQGHESWWGDDLIGADFYEQVNVPQIGRRSDLIVTFGPKRLVNIEFKLSDYKGVFAQAKDHLHWADYSYICMPINYLSIMGREFLKQVTDSGLGFIAGNKDVFVEIIRARHNTYKAGKRKAVRSFVLGELNKRKELRKQQIINF